MKVLVYFLIHRALGKFRNFGFFTEKEYCFPPTIQESVR